MGPMNLLAERPFDEILAPFRRNLADSRISDDDLDDLFARARE